MLIRSILSICIVFLLATNAFAISASELCNNFAKKTVKSDSLPVIYKYLQSHPKDFLANFCYGKFYSWQKRPYNSQNDIIKAQYYPIQFYMKAIQYTKNPAYKALAYMWIGDYYGNNNGFKPTIYTTAKAEYNLNKALKNALEIKDKNLILDIINILIESGDPLKIDKYLALGKLYATTNSDKIIFYELVANRYNTLKDYNKALYYNLQNLKIQIKEKMYFNIVGGVWFDVKYDMLRATDTQIIKEAMQEFIAVTEYLQTHPNHFIVFRGTKFTNTDLAAESYDNIGDLLYGIQNYQKALLNYKASYVLYKKTKDNDSAEQVLKSIKKTENAIYYKAKQ